MREVDAIGTRRGRARGWMDVRRFDIGIRVSTIARDFDLTSMRGATGATRESFFLFREIKVGMFLAFRETDDAARRWIERREQRLFCAHRATRSCTRRIRCVCGSFCMSIQ